MRHRLSAKGIVRDGDVDVVAVCVGGIVGRVVAVGIVGRGVIIIGVGGRSCDVTGAGGNGTGLVVSVHALSVRKLPVAFFARVRLGRIYIARRSTIHVFQHILLVARLVPTHIAAKHITVWFHPGFHSMFRFHYRFL